ncbi:hypothetical protein G3I31_32425, partial [Streptomyces sp. SID9913]|uniref:hypothetical protein n=1 Tax=Streptomyces sp. SID9913 TaxID=2706117 RepID=UPI0013D9328D
PADAAALLDDATDGTVDPGVRTRLVTEADGNPALLLALAHRLSPAQLRGHRELPGPAADFDLGIAHELFFPRGWSAAVTHRAGDRRR